MDNIKIIIKKAEKLGWIVKSFEESSYYQFSKRMGSSLAFFNKGIAGITSKEIINHLREEYIDFDLPFEVSCWIDDEGVPFSETPYENLEEIYEAFKEFEKDILDLYLTLDTSVNKEELSKLKNKTKVLRDYNSHLLKISTPTGHSMFSNTSNLMEVDRDMLIFGMRYALGRQTFAPSTAVENIKRNIDKLDNNTIDIMIRDIEEHPGSLGMECDKLTWLTFKQYLINMKTGRSI